MTGPALHAALAEALGQDQQAAPADLAAYAVDGLVPRAVVFPSDVAQVAEVLHLAHREGLAVIPRGGGTAMGMGYPPERLDVVLLTRRMDRVLENEPAEMTATVQAGITLSALNAALAQHSQMLPLDAPQPQRATIGGILAANTSGPRRLGYGTPRDRLIGIHVVDAQGTLVKGGGKVVKNVAGYDMPKLFIGSLGTLGVIVQATFKLAPLPQARQAMLGGFLELEPALEAATALLRATLRPAALDLLNAPAYGAAVARASLPGMSDRRYFLAADLCGTPSAVRRMAGQAHRAITDAGGKSMPIEDGPAQEAFWQAVVDHGLAQDPPAGMTTRCAVLSDSLPRLLHGFEAIAESSHLEVALDAHLPSGIIRASWWGEGGGAPEDRMLAEAVATLRKAASHSGGYLVVESCLPAIKRGIDAWGPAGPDLAIMRRIKEQFDPGRVLSPGRFLGGL